MLSVTHPGNHSHILHQAVTPTVHMLAIPSGSCCAVTAHAPASEVSEFNATVVKAAEKSSWGDHSLAFLNKPAEITHL